MVCFWVLGQFAIELDGSVLEPPHSRRARSLLAWLVLHPGAHLRSRPAPRFWPDVLDTSARASLRVALSELRALLGPAASRLIGDRRHAGLATKDVWVDALAFEELARRGELAAAVELCRGELLPDLDDDWVLEAGDAHAASLVDVLARLASEHESRGDLEGAISLHAPQLTASLRWPDHNPCFVTSQRMARWGISCQSVLPVHQRRGHLDLLLSPALLDRGSR